MPVFAIIDIVHQLRHKSSAMAWGVGGGHNSFAIVTTERRQYVLKRNYCTL